MGADSLNITASDTLQAINNLPGDTSFGWLIFKMAMTLVLVIAVIFAVSWLFKRFSNLSGLNKNSDYIQIVSRMQIAPQKTILIMKIFKKVIAVLETPNHTTVLSEWQENEVDFIPEESKFDTGEKFMEILKRSIGAK